MADLKSKEMVKAAIEAMKDKKAEDIRVIDISNVSVIADYFIIANGNNLFSRVLYFIINRPRK